MRGAALMVVSAALGCACTVGPTYRRPAESAGATGGFASANSPAVAQSEPPERWWHLFHDPVLDELIGEALGANTDLRAAAAHIAGAEAVLAQARAAGSPQTAIRGVPEYSQLSAEQYLLENRIPTLWIYDVGMDVQWRLDVSGQVRRSIEAASADSEAARPHAMSRG